MSLKSEPASQIELYESLGVRKVLWTKSVKESRPSVLGMPPPSNQCTGVPRSSEKAPS